VKEINPTNDEDHLVVCKSQSGKCLQFEECCDHFFFLDENKVVTMYKMSKDTRKLEPLKQLKIKDRDKPNFCNSPFTNMILCEKYIILDSKIFYLYDDHPLQNGILDMEQLLDTSLSTNKSGCEETKEIFLDGPIRFDGSDQFAVIS